MHFQHIKTHLLRNSTISTLIISLGITMTLVSGCATAPMTQKTFDFGASASNPKANTSASTNATSPLRLKLAEIHVNASLESDAMLYRLLYNNAQVLMPYAQSRWSMPPAQLFKQRMQSHFTQQNHVLLSVNEGSNDLPLLRIELIEFSQHFTSSTNSFANLQLRASLTLSNGMIVQQQFSTTHPSTTADAAGGASAMVQATNLALIELSTWIQEQTQTQ